MSAFCFIVASTESNVTRLILENEEDADDDDEESLSNMSLAEFKERYRRLIPYMTFYVANNYVNTQVPPGQNYVKSSSATSGGTVQRRPLKTASRTIASTIPRPAGSNFRSSGTQEKKFVPSLQYDPRNIGGDNDFFAPVRYGSKLNYNDYSSSQYELFQSEKQVYPEITTPASLPPNDNRYLATARPIRPYVQPVREYLPRKQSLKPIKAHVQEDYLLDYIGKPSGKLHPMNYPAENFESVRYVSPSLHFHPQKSSVDIAQLVPARGPPSYSDSQQPSLQQILESFQLTERLPEVLNKGNIDSSIRTLVEILSLLQNSKKEEVPQSAHLPILPSVPQRTPMRLSNHHEPPYKHRYTRPKIVTETNYQATPSPLFLTDDPERYKDPSLYEDDDKSQASIPNYNVNTLNNEKTIEYYTPYIQDISEESKEPAKGSYRPPDISTEHGYAITEDLSEDILNDDRYSFPLTTEAIPPSLKYGATRGKPNVDYPAYATIPQTDFSCKAQRYKGFFGDPATGCQVWHYCDLNGGKASFLCPNGTIFSQVALTCDWWFNVKCESTTQLYVLNERLYKYILPIMPKFPEDFTGPEVDRYLELKFKEMEAKLKEKKLKKQKEEKEKEKEKAKEKPQISKQ
ncbi:uncharacterized protein [Prorops nasuta]|uniref:uncharacterized protein n=1 Tax=Prorops nasuta TaxID=863751 RepID=UPI0034CE6708